MTRIVRIRLTLEVPDDVDIQVNRDETEGEGPETFEGYVEIEPGVVVERPPTTSNPGYVAGNPMPPTTLAGPAPLCPRHKKSRERGGAYFCPTVISPPGVEPKVWCEWRVKTP